MVTIGLSTVSVVTSILIIRLSGVSTPFPTWLRHSVFRSVARLMCVQLSPPFNKSAVAPDDGQGSRSKLVNDSDAISMDAGNNRLTNDSRDLGNKVDDLLFELRKVGCASSRFHFTLQSILAALLKISLVCKLPCSFQFEASKHTLQY